MRFDEKSMQLIKTSGSLKESFRIFATNCKDGLRGEIKLGKASIYFPEEYIGKRLRLKVEWVENAKESNR